MRWLSVFLAILLMVVPIVATAQPASPSPEVIACRALETYTDGDLRVTVIVFHQRDETQRSALSALLQQHSGDVVEIQGADGKWRRARMTRLKSCFGRGLLLLPSDTAIAEHAEFQLRSPAAETR